MKNTLLYIYAFLSSGAIFSQVTFTQVEPPKEFALTHMSVSPYGEKFFFGVNNSDVYTTNNNLDFKEYNYPDGSPDQDEMYFFDDGTPLFSRDEPTIRQGTEWKKLDPLDLGNWRPVSHAYIYNDTLFFCQNHVVYYSIDKGETYDVWIDDFSDSIISLKAYVYGNKTLISYSEIIQNQIFHYTKIYEGSTFVKDLELPYSNAVTIGTNQVVSITSDSYRLYDFNTDTELAGDLDILFSDFDDHDIFVSSKNYFYRFAENEIYRSQDFLNGWEIYKTLPRDNNATYLVDYNENIYKFGRYDYAYESCLSNQENWTQTEINYSKPYIKDFQVSSSGTQFCQTYHFLYRRPQGGSEWVRDTTYFKDLTRFILAGNNDLFIINDDTILHSNDESNNYQIISTPIEFNGYLSLSILSPDILLFIDDLNSKIHYSIDTGETWLDFVIENNSYIYYPSTKVVNNEILIASAYSDPAEPGTTITGAAVFIIDIASQDVNTYKIENYNIHEKPTILDNGTVIFEMYPKGFPTSEGLYSFSKQDSLQFIFESFFYLISQQKICVGNAIYIFDNKEYQKIENGFLETLSCSGLPNSSISGVSHTNSGVVTMEINHSSLYICNDIPYYNNTITGSIAFDEDKNCIAETEELNLDYIPIEIKSDSFTTVVLSNLQGEYYAKVPQGEYIVEAYPPNELWTLCEEYGELSIDEFDYQQYDIPMQANEECALLFLDFSTPYLRRCFDNRYSFFVANYGTKLREDLEVTIHLDPYFSIVDCTLPYEEIGNDQIRIHIDSLEIGGDIKFNLIVNVSCDSELGETHCLEAFLNGEQDLCTSLESNISNIECQENKGSFDPNDKRCFNEEGYESDLVDLDEYFYYHIRFQNTGTDTAFNIKVIDPISEKLDLSTFEMLSSSHENEYLISDGPQLEVYFDNILLPDSTINLVGSNGYFKFRIKPLAEYAYGESFENQAAIYFDFNEPIYTNTTETILGIPTSTEEIKELIQVEINPNPTQDIFTLTLESKDSRPSQISIYNDQGQLMTTQTTDEQQIQFDSSQYPVGIYVVKVQVGDEVVSRKLVVVR